MKTKIVDFFKKHSLEATVKYIDPSYMIRSVPANASDSIYCELLAQNVVHGAMVRGSQSLRPLFRWCSRPHRSPCSWLRPALLLAASAVVRWCGRVAKPCGSDGYRRPLS